MTKRTWGCVALVCVSALGCGGQAQQNAGQAQQDAGQEAQSSDFGPPPAGFYALSVETVSDSCQPAETQGTLDELVGAAAKGPNVVLWHTGGKRQDIEWDQPFLFTSAECGATLMLDVTATTSHSFEVDSQIDWVGPKACTLFSPGVPSANCSVRQRQTYELEQACPATRNMVSCE